MELRKFVFYENYDAYIVYAETEDIAKQLLVKDNKNPNDYYLCEVRIKKNDVPIKGVWIDLCKEYIGECPI